LPPSTNCATITITVASATGRNGRAAGLRSDQITPVTQIGVRAGPVYRICAIQ